MNFSVGFLNIFNYKNKLRKWSDQQKKKYEKLIIYGIIVVVLYFPSISSITYALNKITSHQKLYLKIFLIPQHMFSLNIPIRQLTEMSCAFLLTVFIVSTVR